MIPTLPNGQPDMAPPGLILPAQAAMNPSAADYAKWAGTLPPGPQREAAIQATIKNMLTEPDKVEARKQHEDTLRAHYADINERHAATLQQRADDALQRSQDVNRSIEQRAQDAASHRELMVQLAGMRQSGNAPQDVPGDFTKKGEDFLASLPPEDRESIRNVASGKTPLTTFSVRGGHREAIHKMVLQYDDTYNATRPTMYREFTSGATGKNITSINTAISHMGTMSDLADALQNNDLVVANRAINFLKQQTGDPSVTNFETARQAVGEELMRTFRVVGASEHEAQAWMERFKTANSPEQLRGALGTAGSLLAGRIKAVNDYWKRGTQTDKDFPDIIPPDNLATLNRLGVKKVGVPSLDAQTGGSTAAPTPASSKVDAGALAKEAKAAIAGGKDEGAVRARFRQMTGQDLP